MSLPIQSDSDNTDDASRIHTVDETVESTRISELSNNEPIQVQVIQEPSESVRTFEAPADDLTWVQPLRERELKVKPEALLSPSRIQAIDPTGMKTGTQSDFLPANNRQLEVGKTLKNKYFLESRLGEGGMGTVFKARNTLWEAHGDRNPYVAIKVLRPEYSDNKQLVASLFADFKRTRMLSSCPNIVNVQDFDEDGAHVFMALEYLVGTTLYDHLKKLPKPMSFASAWPIMQGIANALDFAHKHNIVHRDIKPDNIFILENNKDDNGDNISADRIKVLDFGIASKINESEGDKTRFNGEDLGAYTPAYASPEMKEYCDPDVRDDIYAFGCVIYEMLTGKQYFKQKKVMTEPISKAALPELSPRQRDVLKKSLAVIRDQRIASAAELMRMMQPGAGISLSDPKYLGLLAAVSVGIGLWWFLPSEGAKTPTEMRPAAGSPVEDKPIAMLPAPPVQPAASPTTPVPIIAIPPAIQPPAPVAAPPVPEQPQPGYNNDSADGLAHIETSKPAYKKGDAFALNYTLRKPMYLRIIDRDAAGAISPLFPNKLQADKLMPANKTYKFPPRGKSKVNSPAGTSTVTLIASEQPFPKNLELLAEDGSVSDPVRGGPYSWTQIHYNVR